MAAILAVDDSTSLRQMVAFTLKSSGFEVIEAHHRADNPARRAARARSQVLSLAQSLLRQHAGLDGLAESVAEGRMDPYTAAARLIVPDSAN